MCTLSKFLYSLNLRIYILEMYIHSWSVYLLKVCTFKWYIRSKDMYIWKICTHRKCIPSVSVYLCKKAYIFIRDMYTQKVYALRKLHNLHDCILSKTAHSLELHTLEVCCTFCTFLQYAHFSTHSLSLQILSIYISLQFAQSFSLHALSICTLLEFTKVHTVCLF